MTPLSIEDVLLQLCYVGLALLMFVESVLPPVPSELIMPLAGYLCGKGQLSLPAVIAVGTPTYGPKFPAGVARRALYTVACPISGEWE